MEQESCIRKSEREMIVVATSDINQCQYCVVAHGAILRIRRKDTLIADQIAVNYRKADISERQRIMLDFAVKVSQRAHEITEADRQLLRDADFADQDIWDVGAIAAFFALSNRLVNLADIRPNEEFHILGRMPQT